MEILPRLETRLDVPPTRLRHTAEQLVGRDAELTLLDGAWNNPHTNLLVIRGKGGEGKTALVAAWMAELAAKDWRGAERVLDWPSCACSASSTAPLPPPASPRCGTASRSPA